MLDSLSVSTKHARDNGVAARVGSVFVGRMRRDYQA